MIPLPPTGTEGVETVFTVRFFLLITLLMQFLTDRDFRRKFFAVGGRHFFSDFDISLEFAYEYLEGSIMSPMTTCF